MVGKINTITTNSNVKLAAKENITNTAKAVVDKTRQATKKLSNLDVAMFRQYLFSKQFNFNTTKEELVKLFSYNDEEFFDEAYNFLYKKLGYPESLKPKVAYYPLGGNINMAYGFDDNTILRNSDMPNLAKETTFIKIRHELQHFAQNIEMLRHPEIGPNIIEHYTRLSTGKIITDIDYRVRNFTLEQLKEMGLNDETLELYKYLQNLIKNKYSKYEDALDDLYESTENFIKERNTKLRDTVVKELGFLEDGSKQAKRATKYYNEFMKSNYWQGKNNIHIGKYICDLREEEAAVAELVAQNKLKEIMGEKICYIKGYKDRLSDFSKMVKQDSKMQSEVQESSDELTKNFNNDLKKYLDYLYN